MKVKSQYKLIASLLSVPTNQKKSIGTLRQHIHDRFQIIGKLRVNEVLLFRKKIKQSHVIFVATEAPTWQLLIRLFFTRAPAKKLISTESMPIRLAQKKLALDSDTNLNFFITGNATLIFSAKTKGTNIIAYWADTEKGCESIQRQHSGLKYAIHHFKKYPQHIPNILMYRHIEDGETLLQVTELAHDHKSKKSPADIWIESSRLADYSLSIFNNTGETTKFPSLLLKKVIAGFEGDDLALISEIGNLLEKWQDQKKPLKIPIHGDLWHGNALFDYRKNVCGIIDWEWFSEEGILGFDAIHCLIISHAVLKKQSVFKTIRIIATNDESDEILRPAVVNIAAAHSFDKQYTAAIVCLIWLTVIYRSHVYTGPRSSDWLSDAIRETAPLLLKSFENND